MRLRSTSAVVTRLDRAIQYAAASRFYRWRLWNTGSPGHRRAEATPSFGRLCRAMTAERAGLLLRHLRRKLAVAHPHGKAFDEFRHRVLAIGADQFGECGKHARLR